MTKQEEINLTEEAYKNLKKICEQYYYKKGISNPCKDCPFDVGFINECAEFTVNRVLAKMKDER